MDGILILCFVEAQIALVLSVLAFMRHISTGKLEEYDPEEEMLKAIREAEKNKLPDKYDDLKELYNKTYPS